MRSARLEMALDSGAFVLPPLGDIVVLSPQAGDDLSALPKARVVVLTGFKQAVIERPPVVNQCSQTCGVLTGV